MTLLPIFERELRTQSRLAFTYNLRVLGALAVLLVWLLYSFSHPLVNALGGELFSRLNCALFGSIWVLVPLLCADCISRERREGTVGLLFLTPLRARDVVLAKGLVHGLRAFSLLLTALPVITIAFLLGGVSWSDALLSLIMNLSSLCWALSAGLIASCMSKTWVRSQLVAFMLASGFGYVFLMAVGLNTAWHFGFRIRMPFVTATWSDQVLQIGLFGATDIFEWWGRTSARLSPAAQWSWILAQSRIAALSIIFLLLSIEVAARNLRRFWREEPPSERREWLEQKLFTPILMVSFLRGWMRRKLERNPIGWLEQRTWSGRLVMWGWFAVMISIYSAVITKAGIERALDTIQEFMGCLLLGVMGVTAAGSFRRERETGVLELLLVSPVSVGEIIGGRLRGLWGQFLPAFVVLLGIWTYLGGIFPGSSTTPGTIVFFCSTFFSLPVFGLYYSLRRPSFISAFLLTLFMGGAVPFGLQLLLSGGIEAVMSMNFVGLGEVAQPVTVSFLQLAIAAWIWWRLYRDMERRNFPFTRGGK